MRQGGTSGRVAANPGAANRRCWHPSAVRTGKGTAALADLFAAMPLWLATPGFRAVHACWHPGAARSLAPHLDDAARILPGSLPAVLSGPARTAVETLLAGPTVSLPEGLSTVGRDGSVTRTARARWWSGPPSTWGDAVAHPGRLAGGPIEKPPHANAVDVPGSAMPTLFGSLLLDAGPCVLGPLHACLDVGDADRVSAYRWDGERTLAEVKVSAVAQPGPPLPLPPPVAVASPTPAAPRQGRRRRRRAPAGGR